MRKRILARCLLVVAGMRFQFHIALPESRNALNPARESWLDRAGELNGSAERLIPREGLYSLKPSATMRMKILSQSDGFGENAWPLKGGWP